MYQVAFNSIASAKINSQFKHGCPVPPDDIFISLFYQVTMCLYNKKKKRNLPCANKRLFLVDVHFIADLVKSFRDTDCVVHLQHLLCLCLGDFFVEQGLQVVVIKMPESVNKRLKIKDFIRQTPKRALGHFKDGEL